MKQALILCSGGIDSVVTANYVKKKLKYDKLKILFFNYRQKSVKCEKKCSLKCANQLGAEFISLRLPELGKISTSLINRKGNVNKLRRTDLKDTRKESENWYVPYRNSIFLTYALALVESEYLKNKKKYDIFIGFKNEGIGGFPDTSAGFLKVIKKLGTYSSLNGCKIITPFIKKDKSEVIKIGNILGVDFRETFSCYIGKENHCGYCLNCRLRQEGFYWANLRDPTNYKIKMKDLRFS